MDLIPINLAVEDPLSEAVLRTILHQSNRRYIVGNCYSKNGFGYLKKNIKGFNNAAKGTPYIVLTDLDRAECPQDPLRVRCGGLGWQQAGCSIARAPRGRETAQRESARCRRSQAKC